MPVMSTVVRADETIRLVIAKRPGNTAARAGEPERWLCIHAVGHHGFHRRPVSAAIVRTKNGAVLSDVLALVRDEEPVSPTVQCVDELKASEPVWSIATGAVAMDDLHAGVLQGGQCRKQEGKDNGMHDGYGSTEDDEDSRDWHPPATETK